MKRECRLCGSKEFIEVLDMGEQPLVNSLIEEKDIGKTDKTYPLKVEQCTECGFVQVVDPIDAYEIYRNEDYLYFSGDMPGLSDYFAKYAHELDERFGGGNNDFVVEIGSNDGTMLKHFPNILKLGVDPATNTTVRAIARGIPTVSDFFNERTARSIAREFMKAKIIYGNNCIAHIHDLDSVLKGVDALLGENGVFVVECNWWGGMVENLNYSLIYHDHFSYFTAQDWIKLAPKYGMFVFDAYITPAQGGSLRIFMAKDKERHKVLPRLADLVKREKELKLGTKECAKKFNKEVTEKAKELGEKVKGLAKRGKIVAGYGAAAKGFSILSLAGITNEISHFVDDSPAKQGKFTPVHHIPVVRRNDRKDPDVFIITAPNYADVIKQKESSFKGEWITP